MGVTRTIVGAQAPPRIPRSSPTRVRWSRGPQAAEE